MEIKSKLSQKIPTKFDPNQNTKEFRRPKMLTNKVTDKNSIKLADSSEKVWCEIVCDDNIADKN